jgi:hypothetical protein
MHQLGNSRMYNLCAHDVGCAFKRSVSVIFHKYENVSRDGVQAQVGCPQLLLLVRTDCALQTLPKKTYIKTISPIFHTKHAKAVVH